MTVTQNRKRRVTGAILCGGASSRMGMPKHAIVLHNGRAMIADAFDALMRVCGDVVLVHSSAEEARGLRSLGFSAPMVTDLRTGMGPLGGIEALLASGIDESYIVCPCDVPRITAAVLESLLIETDALSTVARVAGSEGASPLPARISAPALPVVREMLDEGRRAVHHLHERLGAHVVEIPAEWEPLLMNVNTPADLEELNRR